MEHLISLFQQHRNKILLLSNQVFVSGANFLLVILTVRFFGLHIFGEHSVLMIVVLGVLGVNQAIISAPFQSLLHQNKFTQYTNKMKGGQIPVLLILITLSVITLWVMDHLFSMKLDATYFAIIQFGIGYILFDLNRKVLLGNSRVLVCLVKDTLSLSLQLITLTACYYLDVSINFNLFLLILGGTYSIIELPCFLFVYAPSLPSKQMIIEHWEFGKWLLGNSVLQWFSGNFYLTVGAGILGVDTIGIIRLGQSTIGLANVLIQIMENYIPPVASKIYNALGWKSLKKYMLSFTIKGTIVIVGIAIVMMLFKNTIWEIFYGTDQIQHSYILYWFGIFMVINFWAFPLRYTLRTLHKTRVLFEAYVLSSLFGFTTAHLFINLWKLEGVCLGLILTQVILEFWYLIRLWNKKHL